MQEQRVDPRLTTAEEHTEGVRQAQVLFKLNHTMPYTDEYNALVRELFGDNLGEGGWVMPGLTGVCFDRVHIGKNVKFEGSAYTKKLKNRSGSIFIRYDYQLPSN